MKLYKILSLSAIVAAVALTSCSDDKDTWTPGTGINELPPAYFEVQSEQQVVLGMNDTAFSFVVYRASNVGDATFDLAWNGDTELFTLPAQAFFENGEYTDTLQVTFVINDLEQSKPYTMTVTIPDTEDTNLSQNEITFVVEYTPWKDLGMCTYVDNFVGTFFSVGVPQYEVQLEQHPTNKGLYRLVNPYGEGYPYNEPGDWDDTQDYFMYINATDPAKVFICDSNGDPAFFYSGMDWGYGEFVMTSMASYYLMRDDEDSAAEYYGTMNNGMVSFSEGSLLVGMTDYNGGGLYAGGEGGVFMALPGIELWADLGNGEWTDGIVSYLYEEDPLTYYVPVQQSLSETSIYRLVDPYYYFYGNDDVKNDSISSDYDIDLEYLQFDAEDPDCVFIPDQFVYEDWDDEYVYDYYVMNYAEYLVMSAEAEDKTLSNNSIIEFGYNDTFDKAKGTFVFSAGMVYTEYVFDINTGKQVDASRFRGGDESVLVLPGFFTTSTDSDAATSSKATNMSIANIKKIAKSAKLNNNGMLKTFAADSKVKVHGRNAKSKDLRKNIDSMKPIAQ